MSAIEMALWDLAGKVAGLPVHKLLGGRVRDRVRVYNGGVRFPLSGQQPADYAANMTLMKNAPEGFTIIKQGIGYHSAMASEVPGFAYNDAAAYREVTRATSTPIHTGEQIYLRQNFRDLIEQRAVRVVGPDPCDVRLIPEEARPHLSAEDSGFFD